MIILSGQIRAARAGLRWTQQALARKARVDLESVRRIEGLAGSTAAVPRTNELLRIIAVFHRAGLKRLSGGKPGVVFPDGDGVRFRLTSVGRKLSRNAKVDLDALPRPVSERAKLRRVVAFFEQAGIEFIHRARRGRGSIYFPFGVLGVHTSDGF